MATEPRSEGIVYRRGKPRLQDVTPRPGKDTIGRPGQEPGLSTFETPTTGKRELAIDLARLKPPLRGIADDAALGGTAGHVSIVPVDENGRVAKELLEEWAASRDQDEPHPFTQIILDAIVPENERGSP